jgi:DnaJ-class molecular chaperone
VNQQEARKLLGLENAMPTLTEEIVKQAFRRQCMLHHPDTAAQAEANMAARTTSDDVAVEVPRIDTLTKAKIILLQVASGADLSCKTCAGRGRVPARMGWQTCSVCKGSGDKR